MNRSEIDVVHRYLDGMLADAEIETLNAWIKAAPENAAAFAELVRFHDHLQGLVQATHALASAPAVAAIQPTSPAAGNGTRRWHRASLAGVLVAAAAVVCLALWWSLPSAVSAAVELDRLIAVTDTQDRSYAIRSLDRKPEQPSDRRPPIDGARLYVRYPAQYVLIRKFPDGRPFATGSDGERSWAVPPDGAVRVSADPLRYRGPVPGHQHGLPFVDLRSDLVQLRAAYDLAPLGVDQAGHRGLRAIKKSAAYRGPNRVELWYDPATGVIHRMVLSGMPKARGGPDSVAVDLLETTELGSDFFRHGSHHTPDRRVIEED